VAVRMGAPPVEPRVSTGHPPLDTMLDGGLLAHRPYLIVGPSGTGKTTLSLQFLCEGVRRGERCLLVTLEEPPNEVRLNHRSLGPDLDHVEVFDAIPDVMRYERVPFKDISSVRQAVPFGRVQLAIRHTPELSSVEVTIAALEQMLRTEVHRCGYSRLVIDSLTALQYFCMKGFDPIAGAQAFLRFLSDLRTTTLITVESPLEDSDTPERMLARGEIRLFRWELEGATVRAIGVEKFRGSAHDVRLHPYRLGPNGVDINLDLTISRDTRQIVAPAIQVVLPALGEPVLEASPATAPLSEAIRDLVTIGVEAGPVREEVEAAIASVHEGHTADATAHVARISSLAIALAESKADEAPPSASLPEAIAEAYRRVVQRAEAARSGVPPTQLPAPEVLEDQLGKVLRLLPKESGPSPPERSPLATVPPAPAGAPESSVASLPAPGPSPPSTAEAGAVSSPAGPPAATTSSAASSTALEPDAGGAPGGPSTRAEPAAEGAPTAGNASEATSTPGPAAPAAEPVAGPSAVPPAPFVPPPQSGGQSESGTSRPSFPSASAALKPAPSPLKERPSREAAPAKPLPPRSTGALAARRAGSSSRTAARAAPAAPSPEPARPPAPATVTRRIPEPPPLPTAMRYPSPEQRPAAEAKPASPPALHPSPPRSPSPARSPLERPPPLPPSLPTPVPPAPDSPAPSETPGPVHVSKPTTAKRGRRSAAAKRSPAEATHEPTVSPDPTTARAAGARPRRRAVRKRQAPAVVAATAEVGAPPEEPTTPAPPADSRPPKEGG
jgi:KaiC/GvpD/RAD55 family RecA-like ATPase